MLFGRAPSYRRGMDLWSPSSGSVSPVASLSPTLAFGNPAFFEGVAPDVKASESSQGSDAGGLFGLGSPDMGWSSMFGGMKAFSELSNFPTLTMQDRASPSASSETSSGGPAIPALDSGLKLPAWCSEPTSVLSPDSDGFDDILNLDAEPVMPTRRLRRTGKLNGKKKIARVNMESSSPDLGGGGFGETTSFVVDPFLDPTPANRPLRQYVSAPVLSPQQMTLAAPDFSASGMVTSASMDDILSDFGWSDLGAGSRHNSSVTAIAADSPGAGPSSSSTRGSFVQSQQYQQQQQHQASSPYGATAMAGPSSSTSAGQPDMSPLNAMSHQHSSEKLHVGDEIDGSLYKRRAAQKDEGEMPNPTIIETTGSPKPAHHSAPTPETLSYSQQLTIAKAAAPRAGSMAQVGPVGGQTAADLQAMQMMQFQMSLRSGENLGQFPDFTGPSADQARHPVQMTYGAGPGASHSNAGFAGPMMGFGPQPGTEHLFFYNGAPVSSANMGPPSAGSQMSQTSPFAAPPSQKGTTSPASAANRKQSPARPRKHSLAQPPVNALDLQGIPEFARSQSTVTLGGIPPVMPYAAHQVPLLPTWSGPTPWLQNVQTPSSASSTASTLPSSTMTSFGLPSSADSLTATELPPKTPPTLKSKKAQSSPNLRADAADVHSSPTGSSGGRKIASNRRVQSAKDLRARSNSLKNTSPAPGSPSKSSLPSGGFSFVNYGIEDAQELCSAVAPSGSYKIPLKGYGGSPTGLSEDGMLLPGSASAFGSPTKKISTMASPSKTTRPRIRAPVDNSRWIIETGEDSFDEDSEDEEDDEHLKAAAAKRAVKKRKSEEKLPVLKKSASSPRLRK